MSSILTFSCPILNSVGSGRTIARRHPGLSITSFSPSANFFRSFVSLLSLLILPPLQLNDFYGDEVFVSPLLYASFPSSPNFFRCFVTVLPILIFSPTRNRSTYLDMWSSSLFTISLRLSIL